MKTTIAVEKLAPLLEEKFDLKFEQLTGTVLRKSLETDNLVLDPNDESCAIAKISTIDVDRAGDVMIPEGIDTTEYEKNPVVLTGHDYSKLPIGKIVKIQKTSTSVLAKIKFSDTPEAQNVLKLVKEGILRSNSVGFVALETLRRGTKEFTEYVKTRLNGVIDKGAKQIITKWKLLENSLVSIPCNAEATILAVKELEKASEAAEQAPEPVVNEPVKVEEPVKIESIPEKVAEVVEDVQKVVEDVKETIQDVQEVVQEVAEEVKPVVDRFIRLVHPPKEEIKKSLSLEIEKRRLGKLR